MRSCLLLGASALLLVSSSVLGQQQGGVRSPLLQVWGVNLAGTRPLTPSEVLGVGVERVQHVAFDPDEGLRLRSSYQKRFGPGGQHLIDLLGQGQHVDEVTRRLENPAPNVLRRRHYTAHRKY